MKKTFPFFKYENISLVISLVAFTSVTILFQNCGNNLQTSTMTSIDASLDIPDQVEDSVVDEEYKTRTQVSKLVANRVLVTNIFKSVFGAQILPIATTNIGYKATEFGSAFGLYDTIISKDCDTKKTPYVKCSRAAVDLEAQSLSSLNVSREAYRIRTCHSAVTKYALTAIQKFDSKATASKLPAINDANLLKAFRLFFRTQPEPNQQLFDALTIASQSQSSKLAQWKAVLLPICLSPHWQVL